ncbi:MAG TPA: hypothetical protein VLH09_15405, partial [Bryobacteraceae bacterium]|nr:hypothetical protein [Bryobacteraceae bacterium]
MQARSGLLTLHLRRRSNTAGELKNGVSKPASQHGLKCRRSTDKPTGGSRTMEADLDGVQLHAIHGGIFSKAACTSDNLCYGPARCGEGVCCVTASQGEEATAKIEGAGSRFDICIPFLLQPDELDD